MIKNSEFISKCKANFGRFKRDEDGVAAIEFAIIMPVMIAIALGSWELSSAMRVKRKADHASSTLADLVTQGNTISQAEFQPLEGAIKAIIEPYTDMDYRLCVAGVKIEGSKQVVKWEFPKNSNCASGGGSSSVAKVRPNSIPVAMRVDKMFYVMSAAEIDYEPVFGGGIANDLTFRDEAILVPRLVKEISCTDCN